MILLASSSVVPASFSESIDIAAWLIAQPFPLKASSWIMLSLIIRSS